MTDIFKAVENELARQKDLYGTEELKYLPDGVKIDAVIACANVCKASKQDNWFTILLEEVAEAFSEEETQKRVDELVQVAALAIRIIEAIERE